MKTHSADLERRVADALVARHAPHEWPTLFERFLERHAPLRRREHGAYYTPREVVEVQVRLAAEVLREYLGCADDFADERVLVVDPATGSGTYPLAVLDHAGGPVRMRLFEPMAGAARLARASGLEVEQVDALTMCIGAEVPVVVCLGNPPYRRRMSRVDAAGIGDFVAPAAGIHAKNVHNDYVYFWRWAIREVFERRAGPGLISFVTASSYLHGPAFGAMRELMRRVLDELWVIDLEGDRLASRRTANVFPIRTPVAIAMAARLPRRRVTLTANVHYTRISGSREAKLATLRDTARLEDLQWSVVQSDGRGPLVTSAPGVYQSWPLLTDIFPWQISGAQLKRTWPIGHTPEVLRDRWRRLIASPPAERAGLLVTTRDRDVDGTPFDLVDRSTRLRALSALPVDAESFDPVPYAYRSFDRQWVLPDARLGDFMRPSLWRSAGPRQVFLTSLLTNVLGPGPAAIATALVPDMDHFRGAFGARAVIPLFRDADGSQPNVAPDVIDRLSNRYGSGVSAEMLLAYCYALLGTRQYVARFEEELRVPGPRIPFASSGALFERTARLGERLLAIHTFRAILVGDARVCVDIGEPFPAAFAYDAARAQLTVGEGVIAPVQSEVWDYSISSFQPLSSWLRRRIRPSKGKSALDGVRPTRWSAVMTRELLEVIWLIEATLALEPLLDAALNDVASGCAGGEPRPRRVGQ